MKLLATQLKLTNYFLIEFFQITIVRVDNMPTLPTLSIGAAQFSARFYKEPSFTKTSSATVSPASAAPILFSAEKYPNNDIEKFIEGPHFEPCVTQYKELLADITEFVDTHANQIKPAMLPKTVDVIHQQLAAFEKHVSKPDPRFYKDTQYLLYSQIKELMHELQRLLANSKLSLQDRLNTVKNIAERLDICPDGIFTDVQSKVLSLKCSNTLLRGPAYRIKTAIIEAAIGAHLKKEHGYDRSNVHFVNAYWDHFAETYGIHKRNDTHSFDFFSKLSEEQLQRCKKEIDKVLKPERLLTDMADEYLGSVQNAVNEAGISQPFDAAQSVVVDDIIKNRCAVQLNSEYGEISKHSYLPLNQECMADHIDSDPTLVAVELLNHLKRPDIDLITADTEPVKLGQLKDGGVIKVLGSLAWLENQYGEREHLDTQDLLNIAPQAILQSLRQQNIDEEKCRRIVGELVSNVSDAQQTGKIPALPETWRGVVDLFQSPLASNLDDILRLNAAAPLPEMLKILIDDGVDINAADADGKTAIAWAASKGRIDCLQIMIDAKADLDAQDINGKTALIAAAAKGHLEILELLIKNKAKLEIPDRNGNTALLSAAENGKWTAFDLLVKNKASVQARNRHEKTALMLAIQKGDADAMKLLFEKGAKLKKSDLRALTNESASISASANAMKLLLEIGVDLEKKDFYGQTLAMRAAINGNTAVLKVLIEKGANLNAKNKYGKTAAMLAIENRNSDTLELLLKNGVDPEAKDKHGETLAMLAVTRDHVPSLKLLLEHGADLETKTKYGMTACMLAARYGRIDCLKFLIEKNANVNASDKKGTTALMAADKSLSVEVLKLLLNNGAELEAKDKAGNTACSYMAWKPNALGLKLLIENGADVNVRNKQGNTAAMLTVMLRPYISPPFWLASFLKRYVPGNSEHVECLKLLADAGANLEVRNKKGQTATDLAKIYKRSECLKILPALKATPASR